MAEAHTVPRIYLKGFADQRLGISVYNAEVNKPSHELRDVKRVSTRDDFYVFYNDDGTHNTSLETGFSQMESQLRHLLKRVRSNKSLSQDDRQMLALAAAVQEARSERHRNMLVAPLKKLIDTLAAEMRAAGESEAQISAHVDLFLRKNVGGEHIMPTPDNLSLAAVPLAIQIRYAFFKRMSKCIVRSHAQDFLTCDHPVVWTDPLRDHVNRTGFDFLSLTAEVVYPLTKRHCLVMAYIPLLPEENAEELLVTRINARVAGNAYREVYASPKAAKRDVVRDIRDITASGERRVPLITRLGDPAMRKAQWSDIVGIADELGVERRYLYELNRPAFELFERLGRQSEADDEITT